MKTPVSRLFGFLAAGAVIGIAIFGIMSWRATSTETLDASEASRRIDHVRERFGSLRPVIRLAADGTVAERQPPPASDGDRPIKQIVVLTYTVGARRLTETRIPYWFFRVKAPAAQYAFEGTGLDFRNLGLTAADLKRYGPALLLDHTTTGGSRLLVWTE